MDNKRSIDTDLVFCKLCMFQTKYTRQTFARYHLKKVHNINSKEYYDNFKKSREGICKTCGKSTVFRNIKEGYAVFCSNICVVTNSELKQLSAKKRLSRERINFSGLTLFQTAEFKKNAITSRINKYGDPNYCNTEKIRQTKLNKYGDPNYCNVEKIVRTKINKYGSHKAASNLKKREQSLLLKYGASHISKTVAFREHMEASGFWVPLSDISESTLYRRKVKAETNKWKMRLYSECDGFCYYSKKHLVTNKEWSSNNPSIHVSRNPMQPTIDHIVPVIYGFLNNITPKTIGHYDNLCICSRIQNTIKNGTYHERQWDKERVKYGSW